MWAIFYDVLYDFLSMMYSMFILLDTDLLFVYVDLLFSCNIPNKQEKVVA